MQLGDFVKGLRKSMKLTQPELAEKAITIDAAYVDKQLADIVVNRDLTQFIL